MGACPAVDLEWYILPIIFLARSGLVKFQGYHYLGTRDLPEFIHENNRLIHVIWY